ncbi:uncharacterized protein C20orf96-like isoform X2 [Pomacea canaliculata]|uniref:uncharacterized protein C20orf96-like isoform X2 n=1 Tax=Pomacea canaliculata TaxID=400727 RepID=UPI000D729DC1|nr:uncharacterized protein C20orf96-like isoform X2 [Pomacea canaliculata]
MTSGWGKRAASRIDRTQFGNDELLKTLGQQFNLDFASYDQWERKKPSRPPPPPKAKASSCEKSEEARKTGLSFREKKLAVKQQEEEKRHLERITILELRIQTRSKTLQQYKKRWQELLEENIQLKNEIEGNEANTHDGVKNLLRKYERYRGGIASLNANFFKEQDEAQRNLQSTKLRVQNQIKALEQQVKDVDERLQMKQDELQVLLSYKDKEYPVKAMLITKLQKEIEVLQSSNQEEVEELQHIISTALGKYEKERIRVDNDITRNVTEEAVGLMHPSLKDMALQNMVMKKEIDFHRKQQVFLQDRNMELQQEVENMLRNPLTNTRLQMFPEFFPSKIKCTPDMDMVLDIPIQQWLPI